MKRTDIKPGMIYAKHSSYSSPDPVVFLTTSLYVNNRYQDRKKADPGAQPGNDPIYGPTGWPALVPGVHRMAWEGKLAALRAADPQALLEQWLAKGSAPDGLAFTVITSLNQIRGNYDEELAAWRKARDDADRRRAEANQADQDARNRAETALTTLKAAVSHITGRGDALKARRTDASTVTLCTEDAELITTLLDRVSLHLPAIRRALQCAQVMDKSGALPKPAYDDALTALFPEKYRPYNPETGEGAQS